MKDKALEEIKESKNVTTNSAKQIKIIKKYLNKILLGKVEV